MSREEAAASARTLTGVLLILLLLAAATALRAEPLQGGAKARVLRRMERVYRTTRTIQADFLEKRRLQHLPRPLAYRGRIFLDLERSFLFMDYQEPSPHVLRVHNGTALFYVRGQSTADVFDLENAPGAPPSGGLLNWSPRDFAGAIVEEAGSYRLIPDRSAGRKGSLGIFLDKENLYLQEILIKEPAGDMTAIKLKNLVVNEPLPDRIVDFSLPEGTTINRLRKP